MRFRIAQITPPTERLVLRTHDVEIVADIGLERSRGRAMRLWMPDVDKNERTIRLDLRKLNFLKAWNIRRRKL